MRCSRDLSPARANELAIPFAPMPQQPDPLVGLDMIFQFAVRRMKRNHCRWLAIGVLDSGNPPRIQIALGPPGGKPAF
jgi:hypothetical protein